MRNVSWLLVMLWIVASAWTLACGDDDDDTADDDVAGDDDAADDDATDDDATDDDAADDDTGDDWSFGDITGWVDVDYGEDLVCEGSYCFVACKDSGMWVVDVSDVASPTVVAEFEPPAGQVYNLALDGTALYLANRDDLIKLDVSDPLNPVEEWTFVPTTIGILNAVTLGDGVVYIGGSAGSNGYIEVVGEAKGTPESLGEAQVATGETCYNLGYANDVAYCGGGEGTLISVDVADPEAIAVLDTYFNPGTAGFEPWGQDVKIDGNVLYYSDWGAGLITVDIADPANMVESSVLQTSDGFYGSFLAGPLTIEGTPYAQVVAAANSWGGLALVDATDPAALALIGDLIDTTVDMGSAPHGVWVMGEFAYLADNGEQMLIIVKIAD